MYSMPKDLIDKLITYLGTKPYQESAPFIHAIIQAVEANKSVAKPTPKDKEESG